MHQLLAEEYQDFYAALHHGRTNSLRINTLKLDVATARAHLGLEAADAVPWCHDGVYTSHHDQLGRHLLHALGGIYIQEASAMAVALAMNPQPGERILDLAAAPGGKSGHIAQLMNNQGLLVSNEVNVGRAQALLENSERLGVASTITTAEPRRLAKAWPGYFDRVLLDAPCSGEGMMRKTPQAREHWSLGNIISSATRQLELLEQAAVLVKPGGVVVYSTCTFAPEETEQVLARFLSQHPGFALEPAPIQHQGFGGGRPEWAESSDLAWTVQAQHILRLWPHLVRGEGHTVAVLRRDDAVNTASMPLERQNPPEHAYIRALGDWVNPTAAERVHVFGHSIELLHPETPSLRGIPLLRSGVSLAHIAKDRIEPHHALAHSDVGSPGLRRLELAHNDPRLAAYVRGEVIDNPGLTPGWCLITGYGLGLGWGKVVGGTIKNHYPKTFRKKTDVL
jgi:NOL1/NOP2/sun family putative RNA methylase